MVTAQTVVYVKLYLKRDSIRLKSLVRRRPVASVRSLTP